jgi:hypothetical protein
VVIQNRLDALLPDTALMRHRVTQTEPEPGGQQMLGRVQDSGSRPMSPAAAEAFPARFGDIDHARGYSRAFVDWYNGEHRHSGIGLMTPTAFHHTTPNSCTPLGSTCSTAPASDTPTGRPQAARPAQAADRRVDQQAEGGRRRSLNSNARRLTGLDRLRPSLDASFREALELTPP